MTRKNILNRINKVMEEHEKEIERIKQAYEKDKELIAKEIEECSQLLSNNEITDKEKRQIQSKLNELTHKLINIDKIKKVNSTNTNGIYEGAKILNRMLGFDITKVEINNQDEEREEMEKLTAEELKELININKKENT